MVKVRNNISASLLLNTGAPQGCVLSPLLYSLFTHDCVAMHSFNSIIKFADDTTVVGLITNNDETAYRDEVRALGVWCQENNLSLNVNKGDDCGLQQTAEGAPPYPDRRKKVESFKFLSVHITDKLKWSTHTDKLLQMHSREQSKALTNFYKCTIESILLGCITAWYGNCTALNCKALQRVAGAKLPALHDTYSTPCHSKAKKIIKDNNLPSHCLFTPLSSRRRGQYRCIKAETKRLKNSFYLKAIRLLNSNH